MKKTIVIAAVLVIFMVAGIAMAVRDIYFPGDIHVDGAVYVKGSIYLDEEAGTTVAVIEGDTDDAYETTLAVVEPTADKTVYIPNTDGYIIVSSLATNAVDAANSVWGESNGLVMEGSSADAHELHIQAGNPGADYTLTVPATSTGAVVISSLATNAVNAANSVWGESNGIVFEGATANDHEIHVQASDPGADYTVTIPTGVTGIFMISTLATNAFDIANSVWGESNGLVFEGSAADAHEIHIQAANPGADYTLTVPASSTGALVISTLATNAFDAANSVWGASNAIVFEGATANNFELLIQPGDPGADYTLTVPAATTGSIVISTLVTNSFDVANSVWGESNGLAFEGSSADGNEIHLQASNPGADYTVTIPSSTGALIVSSLSTNAIDAANSVWAESNGLVLEGSSADDHEIHIQAANPGADYTVTVPATTGTILLNTSTVTKTASIPLDTHGLGSADMIRYKAGYVIQIDADPELVPVVMKIPDDWNAASDIVFYARIINSAAQDATDRIGFSIIANGFSNNEAWTASGQAVAAVLSMNSTQAAADYANVVSGTLDYDHGSYGFSSGDTLVLNIQGLFGTAGSTTADVAWYIADWWLQYTAKGLGGN